MTSTPSTTRAWLREPLLHFVVLGALVFGGDHLLNGRQDDTHHIVVSADVDDEARRVFRAARGRDPDAAELAALRQRWVDNEVLYREGLSMRVDRGDTAIRERVIFKSLSLVDASVKLPPYDDATLRQWFEANRSKYDEPARFDFDEAVMAGKPSDEAVRDFVAALNAGTPGDVQAGLRVFKARPAESLVQSYGAEFSSALRAAPVGQWQAVATPDGLRAVRLNNTIPAKPASYEVVRNVVLQDWTDATMAAQRTAAVRTLATKYTVQIPGDAGAESVQ